MDFQKIFIFYQKDGFFMRLFLPRLFLALCLIIGAAAYTLYTQPTGIPVLNYHQINDRDKNALTLSSHAFAAQMEYLASAGYHTITMQELADALEKGAALPEKPVLLTFDDGYRDNYDVAYPILKAYGMKAAIFLITDYVSLYPNYLTWEEVRDMRQNGIEFGSHTLNHVDLTTCANPEELKKQLIDSKAAIEWRLGCPITFLAYPCGSRSRAVIDALKATGYRGAFTVDMGSDHPGDNMYELRRIPIFGSNAHTLLRFKIRLTCPALTASLERLQTGLQQAGYPRLARFLPVP